MLSPRGALLDHSQVIPDVLGYIVSKIRVFDGKRFVDY